MSNRFEIVQLDALEILDCRGDPTVRVAMRLASEAEVWADVPAGRSTGRHEAVELRDGGERYGGLGVRQAVANVKAEIADAGVGLDASDQLRLDRTLIDLDGSPNKSRLGANALLGVSLAAARASAAAKQIPLYRHLNIGAHRLPVPLVNLINGGQHASNDLEFQEFCIFPVGAGSFAEDMEISHAVNQVLREIIVKAYGKIAANVGDEGGFAPITVTVHLIPARRGPGGRARGRASSARTARWRPHGGHGAAWRRRRREGDWLRSDRGPPFISWWD